jgi:hypothetical protein
VCGVTGSLGLHGGPGTGRSSRLTTAGPVVVLTDVAVHVVFHGGFYGGGYRQGSCDSLSESPRGRDCGKVPALFQCS